MGRGLINEVKWFQMPLRSNRKLQDLTPEALVQWLEKNKGIFGDIQQGKVKADTTLFPGGKPGSMALASVVDASRENSREVYRS